MPALTHDHIRDALRAQPLFENKTWRLSPSAWPLAREQVARLEAIGAACLEYHQALETLYLRSASNKNLLRNKPLLAPWAAEYLDRGKPAGLIAHARDPKNRAAFPNVLRPDLLLTDSGFALTELDSIPGGIGLTAFLNRLYGIADCGLRTADLQTTQPAARSFAPGIPQSEIQNPKPRAGGADAMVTAFHDSLASLRPSLRNPLIALLVSDEAATYRPEMHWLAAQLQRLGKRVFCLDPGRVFPLGGTLCFDNEGDPEKIDIIYRFFELHDLANIPTAPCILESWQAGEVAITPPMRHFQEEKLGLALFHHHLLADFWAENISAPSHALLKQLIPASWILDPVPLPPGAVLDGPRIAGRALTDWRQLAAATQKERDLIIKISGYHETAWGARSVMLGSDCPREHWQSRIASAINDAPRNLHILQEYKKPRRVRHALFDDTRQIREADGRLRLCPYYFITNGKPRLGGALATFCPPDKKIIHGMQDAALLPCECAE